MGGNDYKVLYSEDCLIVTELESSQFLAKKQLEPKNTPLIAYLEEEVIETPEGVGNESWEEAKKVLGDRKDEIDEIEILETEEGTYRNPMYRGSEKVESFSKKVGKPVPLWPKSATSRKYTS